MTEKCVCGNEAELIEWTRLTVSSCDGHSSLIAEKFNPEFERRTNTGSVDLYACPSCNTVKFVPRR